MEEVRNWLRGCGLEEYADKLQVDGWDSLEVVLHMSEEDLKNCIAKPGHIKRFQLALKPHENVIGATVTYPSKDEVSRWLSLTGLEEYANKFSDGGWDTLEVLRYMTDEEIRSCIYKPGHRKRFQLDLETLNVDQIRRELASSRESSLYTEQGCVTKSKENVGSWLKRFKLDQYTSEFEKHGWDTLGVIFHMTEECIKCCIPLPGHRKRFELALRKSESTQTFKEESVTRSNVDGKIEVVTVNKNASGNEEEYAPNIQQIEEITKSFGEIVGSGTTKDEITQAASVKSFTSDEGEGDTVQVTSIKFQVEADEDSQDTCYQATESERGNIHVDIGDEQDSVFEEKLTGASKSSVSRLGASRQGSIGERVISSPPIIQSATIFKPKHCLIGGTFEKYKLTQETEQNRRNFKKQMQASLKSAKEKDTLYVETRAFEELKHIVQDRHWAVIIGVPGDGKSAMATHLSLQYNKKGYKHFELHFAMDWKSWVDGTIGKGKGEKQFVVIDDIFGRMSVDERRVSEWSSIIDLMQRVVNQREGDLVVVCTSRKYVYMDVKSKLTKFAAFRETSILDMTLDRFALERSEKQKIWNNYARKYNVSTSMPECVNQNRQSPHGFPHCVELFTTNRALQKEGVTFFENPMKFVCMEIENFIENDRVKYCALLFVLFHKNKLAKNFFEQLHFQSDDVKRIYEAAGLSSVPTKVDLKGAFRALKSTYIAETDNYYSFSHDSIRENLAFMFIKENPVHAIEDLEFCYMTDHTRVEGHGVQEKKNIYVLPQEYNDRLIRRMVKEIRNGNIITVCAHQAWTEPLFIKRFLQFVLETGGEQHPAGDESCIADIFTTKDSTTFDFDLFEALRFFGHHDAVSQLLERKDLFQHIQDFVNIPTTIHCIGPLSLCVFHMMDSIGASAKVREFQMKSAITMEILDSLSAHLAGQSLSCYIFGSHSEGTRIPSSTERLESDVNYVFCDEQYEVIQDISVANAEDKPQLLTITDEETKPGYVKLQYVVNGVPQTADLIGNKFPEHTVLDNENNVVVHRERPEKIHIDEQVGSETTTDITTGNPFNICHSYRCPTWPDITKTWMKRDRHYNWPSRYDIEKIRSSGFFLVPVGCRGSTENHLEWKMSFLEPERILMSSLNDTQYKCYIILKMLNNDIISKFIKEPALVSYHLKTCMFYLIENTPGETWRPDNLLECVQGCLKCILKWTVNGECPNYFNPDENMFYGRIHGELQTNLRNVLQKLLASDFKYLLSILCGNLGQALNRKLTIAYIGKFTDATTVKPDHVLAPEFCKLNVKAVSFIVLVRNRLLFQCAKQQLKTPVDVLWNTIIDLRQTKTITDHSVKQTKRAVAFVLPYVELSFLSSLVARENERKELNLCDILFSKRWSDISTMSNVYSAKLKQATFLYMKEFYDASLEILLRLVELTGRHTVSVCGCRGSHHYTIDEDTKEELKQKPGAEIRLKYCTPCTEFLPTERRIIPDALACEMNRSSEMYSEVNEPYQFWYDWAVVDSKVLLYFLMYLNHSKLGTKEQVSADIKRLEDVLELDRNLGHRETGFNILGWIHRQERSDRMAENCFKRSLSLQPVYNAAQFHLKILK